jgi:serine/threonine protein kinase
MPEQPARHPDQKVLAEFGLGRLDPSESSWIEEHLGECPTCCDTLLNLKDDTFTGLVRSLPEPADESIPNVQPASTAGGTEVDEALAKTSKPEATDGAILNAESNHAVTMLVQSGNPIEPSELPDELKDHPRYRIVEQIGSGGMGDVYRAEHRLMNRSVALKLINSQLIKHPQAVERFRREVQAAAQLTHPNIVTAFDAEQAGDVHFLAMEFVEGTDLATVVKHRGALPVDEACDCIRQAAEGLQHAHEKGMVHRDIKPHNLMLSPDGQVRILDFGLAGFATESAILEADSTGADERGTTPLHLTTFGSVMGTPDYIAPEQARDAHSADIRADIYSLGCTLCFLLKGEAPFEADSVVDKLKAHAEQEPPALNDLRDDVPDELADIVSRMMAKEPADRFQTPSAVATALAAFSERLAQPAAPPVNRSGKRRLVTAVWAGLMSLLAGVIIVVTTQGNFEVRSEIDGVQVTVSKDGDTFRVLDANSGTTVFWLPGDEFQVKARGDVDVTVSPTNVNVTWMGKQVIHIRPAPKPAPRRLPNPNPPWQPEYGTGPITAGVNLINDPSLEGTASGEAYPKTWGNGNLIPKDAWRFEVIDDGRTGKRGWMIEGDGDAATVPSNRPPVDRAFRYAARGWVKVESGMARLGLLYFDKNRRYLSTSHSTAMIPRGEWHQLTMLDDFANHPEAAYVSLALVMAGEGKAVFDDLELIPFEANNLPENFEAEYGGMEAKTAALFDRWVGRWESTSVYKPTATMPDGQTIKSQVVARKILDDRFLMWQFVDEAGSTESISILCYDEYAGGHHIWSFGSDGEASERIGQWDATSQTLALELRPPALASRDTGSSTDRFVSNDHIESTTLVKANDQVTRDVRASWIRKSAEVPEEFSLSSGTAASSDELAVLNRMVGDWDSITIQKPAEWTPDGGRSTAKIKREWILNGRFVLARETHSNGQEGLTLFGFDPKQKAYRVWQFNSEGAFPLNPSKGGWSESQQTLSYVAELDGGKILDTSVHFASQNREDWKIKVTAGAGKVHLDMDVSATRRAAADPNAPKLDASQPKPTDCDPCRNYPDRGRFHDDSQVK